MLALVLIALLGLKVYGVNVSPDAFWIIFIGTCIICVLHKLIKWLHKNLYQ